MKDNVIDVKYSVVENHRYTLVDKIRMGACAASATALVACAGGLPVFAEGTNSYSAITSAMTTGITDMSSAVLAAIAAIIPIGIGIWGAFVVIKRGKKVTETVTK